MESALVDQTFEDWLRKGRSLEEGATPLGLSWSNLDVFGGDAQEDVQKTVSHLPIRHLKSAGAGFCKHSAPRVHILRSFEGLVKSGEMLLVLGSPGSGCSTLLKTLASQTHGLRTGDTSHINYQGLSAREIHSEFRGQCTYQADTDIHFPSLTVNQTLAVALKTGGLSGVRHRGSQRQASGSDAVLRALELFGHQDVKVGGDFFAGLSGGQRRRVSLAEVILNNSMIQVWDNSTRGLDSANALRFIRILRSMANIEQKTIIVSLYQASEEIYKLFDKVALLYQGREIFFGDTSIARSFFVDMGYRPADSATTPDFLTSITNPAERLLRQDCVHPVPSTPDDFALFWKRSDHRARLPEDIKAWNTEYNVFCEHVTVFRAWQQERKHLSRSTSQTPFNIGVARQLSTCITRAFQRLRGNHIPVVSNIIGNCVMSVILGTVFYDLKEDTSSIYGRGVLLFFVVLLNTFLGAFEGVALWEQRPIVEKHLQYAFYHPSVEAIASMLCDIPNKILLTVAFNVPVYFMANLRRGVGTFFTFYLFAFVSLLTGSMLFRTIGAMSRTLTQSIAPGAVFLMLLIIYTGFILPTPSMLPWLSWFRYINPMAYIFESLVINEFAERGFSCVNPIPQGPQYLTVPNEYRQCPVAGAGVGSMVVNGTKYLQQNFSYNVANKWRNLGIAFAFTTILCVLYLLASEFIPSRRSKGDVLIFKHSPQYDQHNRSDIEASSHTQAHSGKKSIVSSVKDQMASSFSRQLDDHNHRPTLSWHELTYSLDEQTKIIEDIEGWVRPGELTALMGPSGAGKTTLLNVLASRVSVGIVGGTIFDASGHHVGSNLGHMVGYAQQQDIHLATATIREALQFSALLRRKDHECSDVQKMAYVEEVIDMLDMREFADAIIGVPGEGLNVEQRKRVTIGVELAAKPQLLLFLDEPISGLDSDTAWSVCSLLRKLAKQGQSILCTIHQPSGVLFEMFDCLLLLSQGRLLYFGAIGSQSSVLKDYFERQGARTYKKSENPAEWLFDVIEDSAIDWAARWKGSEERRLIVDRILDHEKRAASIEQELHGRNTQAAAAGFNRQIWLVTKRNLQNDWRTPSYLYSKLFLILGMGIFNGFSFYQSANSLQGVQSQLFSVFMPMTAFGNIVQLIMPPFLHKRDIYEARERHSRTYSWQVFVLSNLLAELPSQLVIAVVLFITWYYPLGMYHNALDTQQLSSRAGLVFLLICSFMTFCSSFSQAVATIMPEAATGVNVASLLFSLSLIFCGVLVSPSALPSFWTFMYRATPVTYFVSALISTGVSGASIVCSQIELLALQPPPGQSCGAYLNDYVQSAGGSLLNPGATQDCQFCPLASTDALLATLDIEFVDRWRNFGISLCYTGANFLGALYCTGFSGYPKGQNRGGHCLLTASYLFQLPCVWVLG